MYSPSPNREANLSSIRTKLGVICSVEDRFDDVSQLLYATADENGFHNGDWNDAEKIALMHSEVSEAHEAWLSNAQDDKLPDLPGVIAEMADVVIRVMDYSRHKGHLLQSYVIDALVEERELVVDFIDIHSALSEALEVLRKGGDAQEEFGRVVARCFVLVEDVFSDTEHATLDQAILMKGVYNTTREFMHGKKF